MEKTLLVTGGAGFIGSHTCVELLASGYKVVIIDNLINSSADSIGKIEEISGKKVKFYENDLLDADAVEKIFAENEIDGVIHFAGLKAVGESVEKPLLYYTNNLISTLNLCDAMVRHNVLNLVFSSSATVYGDPASVPIREDFPLSTTNPYGTTKLMIERILTDFQVAHKDFKIALLRYFNPIGAHKSGLIGENPKGIPNNLLPYVAKVANGELEKLSVFGNDYKTKDGTGVRDYIHVVDLSRGHVLAMNKLIKSTEGSVTPYNLGTGNGYSVLEIVKTFEKVNGVSVPYVIAPRRSGDIAECYADPTRAAAELGFKAQYNLEEMCKDAWNYIVKNR